MDAQRKAWIEQAEATGYLQHIRDIARGATVPIWWSRTSSSVGSAILHNGTMCAVNTGERTICVTADHVYRQYLSNCKEFEDIDCQIGNVRVQLQNYVVDCDQKLDLATFEISNILLAGSGISVHGAPKWPPDQLRESDIVVLGGYPAMLREEGARHVSQSFVSFLARVAQSSPDHSAVQLNLEDAYWPSGSAELSPATDLGGMSGGPLFRYRSDPLEYLELVGFIYEASTQYEIVFARHASCIDGAGRISR